MASVVQLIEALKKEESRERALLKLSKERSVREDLAPILWNSVGTIGTLLQEILSVYRALNTPNLMEKESNRACNALSLFQCIATHPETKMLFIKAKIPLYLYPFLNNGSKEKPHEYLRLTSLGVIGALVKVDDTEVINFLLESEILPCCLHCMEIGNELSKTVATFIVYKILTNEDGFKYCCRLPERFFSIGQVLGRMVDKIAEDGRFTEDTSKRLLKHIIWCYHRFSESQRACDGLKYCVPAKLRDSALIHVLQDDPTAIQLLQQLFNNLTDACNQKHSRVGETHEQIDGQLDRFSKLGIHIR